MTCADTSSKVGSVTLWTSLPPRERILVLYLSLLLKFSEHCIYPSFGHLYTVSEEWVLSPSIEALEAEAKGAVRRPVGISVMK